MPYGVQKRGKRDFLDRDFLHSEIGFERGRAIRQCLPEVVSPRATSLETRSAKS